MEGQFLDDTSIKEVNMVVDIIFGKREL